MDDRGAGSERSDDGAGPELPPNRWTAYEQPLNRAAEHARHWLETLGERPVGPRTSADALAARFGGPLPSCGLPAAEVIDQLAADAEPGLMAIGSGRFFGWVMGGTLPAALAADWLVSAWDQNVGLRYATPAAAAIEEAAAGWLLEALGLPTTAGVGFVTGATMANFTGLSAGRRAVLARAGWDLDRDGLFGAPRVRVLVGAERHDTVDLALRYLGLGQPVAVAADEQGRIRLDALAEAFEHCPADEPLILCLQAGNLHSGAFDAFEPAIELARTRGAWVHIDGAFGLWAAAASDLRQLVAGHAGADSWATDAHKTLNVPYDCGVAIVADPAALRAAFGMHTSYLISDASGPPDPHESVPELSRRARGVPVWAALRSLGREGLAELVTGLARAAQQLAAAIATIDGAEVLNEVGYTQLCVAFGPDERTRAVTARLLAEGTTWMSGSRWHGREVIRISVSNAATNDEDVRRSVESLRRAAADQ
ncbi:MAG: aspartate aminotransferase family protein [Frankiales bacterium]|nr:aspartate aminotransferase family protein [Frankiales bacterium]